MRPIRLVSAALLLVAAVGCAPAQRPEQRTPGSPSPPTTRSSLEAAPQPGGGVTSYPSPRAGSAYDDPSMGVSTIASAVPGAGAVDAVVLGNVVLAGLPSQDRSVHHKVAQQVYASFPHIVEVRFTSDPAAIGRLRAIRQQIMTQRSISPNLAELGSLSATMSPAP